MPPAPGFEAGENLGLNLGSNLGLNLGLNGAASRDPSAKGASKPSKVKGRKRGGFEDEEGFEDFEREDEGGGFEGFEGEDEGFEGELRRL